MVSVEEFECRCKAFAADIERQATANKTSASVITTVAFAAAAKEGGGERKGIMASSDGAKKDIGFRIETCNGTEASFTTTSPRKPSASSPGVDERSLRFAKQFLDHVAIVFPSALKHINMNCSLKNPQPCVVVRPNFFATTAYEELFLTTEHFPGMEVFLPHAMDGELKSKGIFHCLWQLSGEQGEGFFVPLYALILARIWWAIGEGYSSREPQLNRLSNNRNETAVDVKVDRTVAEKNTGPTETERVIIDVLSHCRDVGDLTMTMDATTLSSFVAPLAEACLLQGACPSSEVGMVENMFMVPLPWILSACTRSLDMRYLDNAVAISLQKMVDHGSTADMIIRMATEGLPDRGVALLPPAQNKPRPGSYSNKARKKIKKRKVCRFRPGLESPRSSSLSLL